MDFVKFWKMVDEHPWLPGIMCGFVNLRGHVDKDPLNLNSVLGIKAIEGGVRYMCFRPWDKLVLSTKPGWKNIGVLADGKTHPVEAEVFVKCYYHDKRNWPVRSQEVNFFTWSYLKLLSSKGKTVEKMIETVLNRGWVMNMIVIITQVTEQTVEDSKGRKVQIPDSNSYDIYIAPPT